LFIEPNLTTYLGSNQCW